ncbi:MAG TPA: hypothetical protein VFQ35_24825 [Polyangiaceae bacterium]|nr:hypothetical protein [Polyangiaceae bacterium]
MNRQLIRARLSRGSLSSLTLLCVACVAPQDVSDEHKPSVTPSLGGTTSEFGGAPSASGGFFSADGGVGSPTSSGGALLFGTGGFTSNVAGGAPSASGGASGGKFSSGSGGTFSSGGTRSSGGVNAAGGSLSPSGGAPASAGSTSTSGMGASPKLPEVSGTCPNFVTGTATIGGLGGISLQVGAKKAGTGSLLFYWHGTGSSAGEVNTSLPAAVRQEILGQGGIIVSFQGTTGTGGDCSGTATFSQDDFKIADLIAACAVRDYGIDPRRIYTTGCSAGGLQAGCMGALRSSYIAAVVPNSGGEILPLPIQDAAHTPSVMTMHGGSSDVVIVQFSQTSAAYDKQMKGAGSFVVNCDHGGGHCAASGALYTAGWEFMKAHPFDVNPEPYGAALPASFPSYCKVY